MPNYSRSFFAALIPVFALPSLLPAFWHDDEPIPKSTITTGTINIALDESVKQSLPGDRWEWVIMPGEQTTVWHQFTTSGSGDNLAIVLTADLPAASTDAPLETTLQVLDADGLPVIDVSGPDDQPLHGCAPIPVIDPDDGPLVWRVQVTSTDTGDLRWAKTFDFNRPRITYPNVELSLRQVRAGNGFTDDGDPCDGAAR
jgi:hypothetical protein